VNWARELSGMGLLVLAERLAINAHCFVDAVLDSTALWLVQIGGFQVLLRVLKSSSTANGNVLGALPLVDH
jgi:hypothetical protein